MLSAAFEPAIPAIEQSQAYGRDPTTTGLVLWKVRFSYWWVSFL